MPVAATRPQHHALLHPIQRMSSSEIETSASPAKDAAASLSLSGAAEESKPVRQVPRVSFNPKVFVRPLLHVDDYTDEEYFATWYTKDEFDEMKRDIPVTIRKAKAGEALGEKETFRGLEYRTREGVTARKANKVAGLMAVLDEQDRQADLGFVDEEKIAKAYMAISERCLKQAQALGAKDELEIRREGMALNKQQSGNGSRRFRVFGKRR